MLEQSPPLHAFFVHFPIAIWLLGTLVLLAAGLARKTAWEGVAWFLLGVGAVMSIAAAVTGQNEIAAVADPERLEPLVQHRRWGNLLPWLMCGLLAAKLHTGFAWRDKKLSIWIWLIFSLAISSIILYTGHLGGILVYAHDLGKPVG